MQLWILIKPSEQHHQESTTSILLDLTRELKPYPRDQRDSRSNPDATNPSNRNLEPGPTVRPRSFLATRSNLDPRPNRSSSLESSWRMAGRRKTKQTTLLLGKTIKLRYDLIPRRGYIGNSRHEFSHPPTAKLKRCTPQHRPRIESQATIFIPNL